MKALDAFGKDIIFVETVGVGQSEVDIVKAADTTMVVLIPGMGDDIQAIKAGILEIGDVFTVNKADHDGADKLVTEINMMLDLDGVMKEWRPPIQKVIANQNIGVKEVVAAIEKHHEHIKANGQLTKRRTERTKNEMLDILNSNIGSYISRRIVDTGKLDEYVQQIKSRETDPYTVVADIMKTMLK